MDGDKRDESSYVSFSLGVVVEWSSQTVLFTSEKLSPRDNSKGERQDSLRHNSLTSH